MAYSGRNTTRAGVGGVADNALYPRLGRRCDLHKGVSGYLDHVSLGITRSQHVVIQLSMRKTARRCYNHSLIQYFRIFGQEILEFRLYLFVYSISHFIHFNGRPLSPHQRNSKLAIEIRTPYLDNSFIIKRISMKFAAKNIRNSQLFAAFRLPPNYNP